MNDYKIILTASPQAEDIKAIEHGLTAYNASQGIPFDWVPLGIFIRGPGDEILGGLKGGTYWGWLYVGTLWIHEDLRGRGFGRWLLSLAEEEAIKRDCKHSFLDTTSFQALPFYQKQGYMLYSQLDDFPPGHSRYFLRKSLRE